MEVRQEGKHWEVQRTILTQPFFFSRSFARINHQPTISYQLQYTCKYTCKYTCVYIYIHICIEKYTIIYMYIYKLYIYVNINYKQQPGSTDHHFYEGEEQVPIHHWDFEGHHQPRFQFQGKRMKKLHETLNSFLSNLKFQRDWNHFFSKDRGVTSVYFRTKSGEWLKLSTRWIGTYRNQ